MEGASRVAARWLEFLFSVALILVTNMETHFDYNAEDDTVDQWFSTWGSREDFQGYLDGS